MRGVELPLLVVSKDLYNESGHLIACPIVREEPESPFFVHVETTAVSGYVLCDNPRQFDWVSRGFFSKGRVPLAKQLIILDMLQALFDFR